MRILKESMLWLCLGLVALVGMAAATELLDAEIVSGGSPAVQNTSGTVRLEDARLGRLGVAVLPVPEPSLIPQLAAGLGLLALLARRRQRVSRASLALLASALLALPALGQVPQDTTFTGRLVDDAGSPLSGPVDLELRIFDADTGGTQLYGEQHLSVPLDATGGFSVQLGLGTSPSGTYDAELFSGADRWLEVVVGAEVLTPRQILGTVPWALIAQQVAPWDPATTPRFEDCGDGTLADHQTGLQWEKKTGTPGVITYCSFTPCPDPRDVNNRYDWSTTGSVPDGLAFTDFLFKLDDPVFGEATTGSDETGCLAGHCDWRLPTIVELQSIRDCGFAACIDPVFGVVQNALFWSASTSAATPTQAWVVRFYDHPSGPTGEATKGGEYAVRAVRTGSCR